MEAYDLWEANDNEKEKWLEQRPICSCCGEHIQDDNCYEINDELICPDCLKENFMKCTDDYM